MATNSKADEALVALRQILRATDMNSRKLAGKSGVTPSQIIILQLIGVKKLANPSQLAREAKLTQATVTSLLDKLEKRGLVTRERDAGDMRRIIVRITKDGKKCLDDAPDLLQERFVQRFEKIADWEQTYLIAALERVASMLDAEDLDASPVLDVGSIDDTKPNHT